MPLLGGWSINQNIPKGEIDPELQKVFKAATEKYVGGKFEATEFLGSQVVNGINYKFLGYIGAAGTLVQAPRQIVTIEIHAGTDGEVKVTKVKNVFDL